MPLKVYISGPISGLDKDYVDKRFSDAKNALIVAGMTPVSPLENGLPETASYEAHMAKDIEMLSDCSSIYMLDGWEKSKGCRIEMAHAIANKKTIIFEQ
jgi:hypothetical protein